MRQRKIRQWMHHYIDWVIGDPVTPYTVRRMRANLHMHMPTLIIPSWKETQMHKRINGRAHGVLLVNCPIHQALYKDSILVGSIHYNTDDCMWEFRHDRSIYVIQENTLDRLHAAVWKWMDDGMPQ